MSTPLHVLILEDRDSDAELMAYALRQSGIDVVWDLARGEEEYLAHLGPHVDVILADYVLPQFGAMEALSLLQEQALDIPFLVVTGSVSEEAAADCIKQGAADYLLKDRLTRLGAAVEQALAAKQAREEKQRMQEALLESEARYRTLFEEVPIGLYRTTPEGEIVDVNATLVEMLGYPDRTSLLAEDVSHLFVDLDERRKEADMLAQEDVVHGYEIRLRRYDGTIIWVQDTVRTTRDADGHLRYYHGTLEDITQRKQLEEQLRRHERLAAIGQLAAGIAHDFRNLLTTIILYGQMSQQERDISPRLRQNLETIVLESKKATDLVQQILDFSSRAMIQRASLDLVDVIESTLTMLQATLPENVHFSLHLGEGRHVVDADAGRIQQALTNLALNARDAMPKGGELRFSLTRINVLPGDTPPVAEMAPGTWVCLAVSDTGTGMTDEVRSHLFEPFFTTKEVGAGTGLGLAQVYGIVRQHGGYIDVQTKVDKGTTFRIFLRETKVEALEAKDDRTTPPQGHGELILLVEDEENLREAARGLLVSLGYRVVTAAHGAEAATVGDMLSDIDLVITDVVMPRMGGQELMGALRRQRPDLKALAITGYSVGEVAGNLRSSGFTDVIHKPFDVEDLARIVRRALETEVDG